MNGTGGQEDVDARPGRLAERLPSPINVIRVAARQTADHRPLDLPGNRLHRLEIARRGDREARFDDVDTEVLERLGDLQLFPQVHAGAWRLLAVAKRRVENDQAIVVGHGHAPFKRKKEPWNGSPRADISKLIYFFADDGVPRTAPPAGAKQGPAAISGTPYSNTLSYDSSIIDRGVLEINPSLVDFLQNSQLALLAAT